MSKTFKAIITIQKSIEFPFDEEIDNHQKAREIALEGEFNSSDIINESFTIEEEFLP